MIKELVKEWIKTKYGNRRPDVIYAHYLESSVYAVDREPRDVNGFVVVGELIHTGIETIAGKAEERCVRVPVSVNPSALPEPAKRFVKGGEEKYVVLCGTADAVVNGIPVEVKTTRRNGAPPHTWVIRAKIYGYLYGTGRAKLIVFNIITGAEKEYNLPAFTPAEIKSIIEKWLMGQYPTKTLL